MVDMARDPRWGRVVEGAGEDVELACRFAEARVRGFQGGKLSDPDAMMATAKHFVAYGAAEGGRDYDVADVSPRRLAEYYYPPFQAAIAAGAASVMAAFHEVNGVPMHANRELLRGVLRGACDFAAGVGMHPSYCTVDEPDSPHLLVPSIQGSLYVAFGSEDKMQSPEDNVPFIDAVRAMPDGRGEADIIEGANHGFAVPRSPAYHEAAASIAYGKAFKLFEANVCKNAS